MGPRATLLSREGIAMTSRSIVFGAACTLLLGFFTGCGRTVPDHPDTAPVVGKITQGGQPVAGASITFVPTQEGDDAWAARGVTDDSGAYMLNTFFSPAADVPGAVPGDYKVTVYKPDVQPSTGHDAAGATSAHGSELAPARRGAGRGHGGGSRSAAPVESALPSLFASASTTTLSATVESGENKIDFDIK